MKKILFLLVSLISLSLFAQERTVNLGAMSTDPTSDKYVYKYYNGTSLDILKPTTQDTIWITFQPNKPRAFNYYIKSAFDTIAGADTTVRIRVYGKMLSTESYTLIKSDSVSVSAAVSKTIENITSDYNTWTVTTAAHTLLTDTTGLNGYPADSISVPLQTHSLTKIGKLENYYRYMMIEYILAGNDVTGTGVELTKTEIAIKEIE